MSKQMSIVKFKGKMDGISFYEQGGVAVARMAKGPSKERIMKDPAYQRTRENISEFGGMALGVSTLLKTFNKVKNMRDKELRSRLSKIIRTIMMYNTGIRGQRSIEISKLRKQFKGLELNAIQKLDSVFSAVAEPTHNTERTRATITLTDVNSADLPAIPFIATHFKLVQFLAVIPDIIYDKDQKNYQLMNPGIEKTSNLTFSEYYPVRGAGALNIVLETALNLRGSAMTENTSVLQCLGIIFFENIATEYYAIKENVAMEVIDVF